MLPRPIEEMQVVFQRIPSLNVEENKRQPIRVLVTAAPKQVGAGEFAERIDLVRFNASILAEYRSTLADLAAETGGRRQRVDHLLANINYDKLSDDQLRRIADGEDPIQVIISGYTTAS
jgi:hypothetical protein